MALYTTVMEEIAAYTGLSPAAFFTIVVLMVALHRTLCGLFVAMGRNINNLILNRNNSSNTTAQPLHQLEEVTDHQLTLPGSSERTTSSMAFQGASFSSTSSTNQWTHDVFLSFRGEDTRYNFTAHLYQAFYRKGIKTFIDDELRRGEKISPALEEAIEKSRISIVVISPNYASSTFCLDELLKIVGTKGQIILPVFYKVDPSDVRHQKNSYEKALAKHEKRFKDNMKVQRWKQALEQVANLSGWHLENNRNEAKFIDEIVQFVSRIVNDTYFQVAKHPVGIESRVEEINSLLSIAQMNDIPMVGILGCGGIGKTSLIKAIYNSIAYQFEGSCFLTNVRETCLLKLQNKILSKILGHPVEVDSVDEGIIVIKKRLCSKRVLLILDDVDNTEQLDKLAGGADWFGSGSMIIITTRDRKVLIDHEVDDDLIYRVKELDREEALELFRWNAFKGAKPSDDFLKLMEGAMNHVGGLPLALEVLGSYLYRKKLHIWKSALNKYKSIPSKKILERLKISYDGLDENEKKIFLDIACFFIGKREDEIKVLESDDYFPIDGIDVLKDKCLINDNYEYLGMHNLLRDMGREVVRQESPEDPSKRSRLWFYEDVRRVFEDDTGTNTMQGILIDLPEGETMWLSSEAFKNMKSLRLLMVNGDVRFFQEPIFLPNELRVLDWPNCPLEFLPSNFYGRKLVVLRMPWSRLKELEEVQKFQSMGIMNFSECKFLKIIPDVSKIPNLRDLTLDDCTNLVEIHDSVGSLDKLVELSLKNCKNLCSFPTSLKLRSLHSLDLSWCSMINYFPEIECEMKYLERISFRDTGIKTLPSSIRYLTGLHYLFLQCCRNLTNLPSSIYQLQHLSVLILLGCSKLVKFPEKMVDSGQFMPPSTNSSVSNDGCSSIAFPALEYMLDVRSCVLFKLDFFRILNCSSTLRNLLLRGSGIVTIPECIKRFVALRTLDLSNCKQLREIQAFPPNAVDLNAKGCVSLDLNNKFWLPELPGLGPVCIDVNMEKFQSVRFMDFNGCEFLKIIPDVSKFPNLEKLTFNCCTNLVEIHDSIGSLDKLVELSFKNCYNLSSFLTSLKLRSLKYLNLNGCSRINHFPEIECEMKYLEFINFGHTGIKKLPSSIRYLIGLQGLRLAGCRNLTNLPSSIYELQHLKELVLSGCSKLVKFPEKMGDSGQSKLPPTNSSVSNDDCSSKVFSALQELDLTDCVLLKLDFFRIFNCSSTLEKLNLSGSGIVTIPACIKRFVALEKLHLNNCKQLREIQAFPQNAYEVNAELCMQLALNNECWLPELSGPGPVCMDINIEKFLSMRFMNFSGCEFLKIIPDVLKIPNLRDLTLNDCTNLVEIHDSVGSLDKLVELSLKNCKNLCSFPTGLKLRSLENLNLNGCSRINHFPEIECEMKYLKFINFGDTGIKKLPSSIRYLIGLQYLHLEGCRNLTNLPSSIYELQHLKELVLSGCSKLVKFPEKMADSGQSKLPPTNSSVSNDDCSSKVFSALQVLDLEDCVLLKLDFFRIFNCSSTLERLNLSGCGIVTIPACIKRFVALEQLHLNNCKQLREIQAFPPNVYLHGCMSLDLYNTCWLPELPPLKEHPELRSFNIELSRIPDWFSYRKEVSNSNSCEIDIDVPADLDGEITTIAFFVVFERHGFPESILGYPFGFISVYVISGGVEIYHHNYEGLEDDGVWVGFHVPESFKRKEYNGHLRVKFVSKTLEGLMPMKSCGFHLVRWCEEKMIDSIDGIQVTK